MDANALSNPEDGISNVDDLTEVGGGFGKILLMWFSWPCDPLFSRGASVSH